MLLVGNDIVDLKDAGYPDKHQNSRFVSRVFSIPEQKAIMKSADPERTLWIFWAAKETAYKLVSKVSSPPVFAHQKFQVTLEKLRDPDNVSMAACATVLFGDHAMEIKCFVNTQYIHATGLFAGIVDKQDYISFSNAKTIEPREREAWRGKELIANHFRDEELDSIHNPESAMVRFHCKNELASRLNLTPERLKIIRPTKENKSQPPFLMLDGKRPDIDVSLSHHGNWLAWMYSLPNSFLKERA